MDNYYDVVVLEDVHKPSGSGPGRNDYFTPKQEKISHSEHNFHSPAQSFIKRNSPDPIKCGIDKRIRHITQSRTELVSDAKSISTKKPTEYRELERGNFSRVPFLPLLSIRTSVIEELYNEIKELKGNIADLEEKNKVNYNCIETGKIRIRDLEDRYAGFKKRAGLGLTPDERREELVSKLKSMHKKWVKNTLKLKSRILELENEVKLLTTQGDSLRCKFFYRSEQHQKLKVSIKENDSSSDKGSHSCDHLNSSSQLRSLKSTPSYNSLSIT
jgi:chromosome segregation ATPase